MQSKLDKMSKLINAFAEIEVFVEKGKIELRYNWSEPKLEASFNGFKKQVEIMLEKEKSKKKSLKKGGGKKTK